MGNVFGAEFRRVDNREYMGKPALVVVLERRYDTTVEDLWEALTTRDRLARWFLPIEGELKIGGRYQLKGNAGGTITHCEAPNAFDVTWEFAGGTTWVNVRLTPEGQKTRLTLEHIAHRDGIGEDHLKKFGPGAVGIGWDLTLNGLVQHFTSPDGKVDAEAYMAWSQSNDGKTFIRSSGEAWGAAHIASGDNAEEARAQAGRTIAFYTGES